MSDEGAPQAGGTVDAADTTDPTEAAVRGGEIDDALAGDDTARRSADEGGVTALLRRLHPLGWVATGLALSAAVATVAGWDLLIARMPWWLWLLTLATIAVSASTPTLHAIRLGIERVSEAGGAAAVALAWVVFFIQLFNVITRYTNDWFDRDILFGETFSLAWMSFGMLFLLGVAYGMKHNINPRIDFWWADWPKRRKAWLDFVLHTFLFLPFLIVGLRVLQPYAARSLGYNRFANDGAGEWPAGWRVWETWEKAPDAGQLPVGPIQAFIFAAFVLWTAQTVAEMIKTGFIIAGREDLGEIEESDVPLRIE